MASTELRRKAQRNRTRAKDKVQTIKRLSAVPVIKKVDIEELKAQFGTAKKAAPKKAAKKKEEVKAEAPVVEETPVAEAKKEEAPAKEATSEEKEA